MSPTVRLPQWCADIIANPPRSGEGFHNWIFRAARALWKCGRSESDIRAILENAADTCGRRVTRKEINDAVIHSRQNSYLNSAQRPPAFAPVNAQLRESIIKEGCDLADLWDSSPIRISDNIPHTEEIIDTLFPGNPLLCCGSAVDKWRTAPRGEWRGKVSGLALIVPSPMSKPVGINLDGEESERCLDNTGPRRFLVIEFDSGTLDDHGALLMHLASMAPMAAAVFSGSKSLHGWFYCPPTLPELTISSFFRYAVSLGADPATWPRCQLVRMPDGLREGGKRQRVYYFNPEVIK
jgi:hypothetical protein